MGILEDVESGVSSAVHSVESGVNSALDAVESGVRSAVDTVQQTVGTAVDGAAHLTGDALNAVGLNSAADAVDSWGDHVADSMGADVPEQQLGQTSDPTQLVHGDASAINASVSHLRNFANAFGETASGLSGVDTSHWTGSAAERFHAVYDPQPELWSKAQQACTGAADAMATYASTVTWAQGQARQAIDLYQQGQQATQQAQAAYTQQVDAYNTAAGDYNAALAAGDDPGSAPTQPGPFSDPGAAMRQQAQQLLDDARRRRDQAASDAARAVQTATSLAPATPSALGRLAADAGDLVEGGVIADEHVVGGIVKGTAGIVDFVRGLNPLDPYNLAHPAEYVDGLSNTAAGLVHMSLHPTQLVVALVGTGWGSDPFEAFGKLVPNVALTLATDGAGASAEAGERAVLGAGEELAADGAENAVRDVAGEPVETTRTPDETPCVDDPVDVASGQVLLPQTDIDLPGVLSLMLTRTHLSGYRLGRWFGTTWASTMDTRLIVDESGVIFVASDGVRLFYPPPDADGSAVLPEEGARLPLRRTEEGGYTVTDAPNGRTFHFPCRIGGGWPIGAIVDRAGHRITFHHNASGEPAEIRHDGGYRVRVTVADGRITGFDLAGDEDVALMRYGYTNGHLTEVRVGDGEPLRHSYDDAGRLIEWLDRNGVRYGYRYDERGRCVQTEGPDDALCGTFDYDEDARVTTHTDSLGVVTRYEYDEGLRLVAETDPLGNTTRWAHHRYGWLLSSTDALGATTSYDYDEAGNLTVVHRPDGTRLLVEYTSDGQPAVVVTPDGAVWRNAYDEHGNRVEAVDPAGAVTRYMFADRGHLAAITDALGNTTVVTNDAAGMPIAVTDPAGAITRMSRDALGRIVERTDPTGGTTAFGWTVDGRQVWRRDPDGSTEHWHRDGEGNVVEHVDQLGHVTSYEYTHFDLPSARTMPDGTRLEYRYDQRLRLASVTNQQGLEWRLSYDKAGRLLAETDFNGATTRYGHDAAGRLISRTNPAGETVTFQRDAFGNVLTQSVGDRITSYAYDPAGRLVRATATDSELTIQRDVLGRIVAESVDGRTLTTRYDAIGRRVERVTPAGVHSRWEYDEAGRPHRLSAAGHTIAFHHDAAGREVERRMDGAFGLVQTWDDCDRLTSQTLMGNGQHNHRSTQPLTMLQRRAYRYGGDGTLAAVVDHLAGTRRLVTDPLGRITAVRGANPETYGYDAAGNLSEAGWPARESGPLGGRDYTGTLVTRAGTIRYRHDAAGRMVSRSQRRPSAKDRVWHYEWDAADRLVGVVTPDGTRWRYRYDPIGRRAAKQRLAADGVTVVEQIDFTWDGSQLVEQDHDTTHVTTWDYARDGRTALFQVETIGGRAASGGQEWFDQRFYAIVTDLVGTPTELVDTRGALAWHEHTTVWGAPLGGRSTGASTPLRFPGQYHDAETGLHYNFHRYYDPVTARYASADPLGLVPSPNPYAYVDNPTGAIDPLGLMQCKTANALKDWQSQRYQIGDQTFLLDRKGMAHILERHSPEFWDGSVKTTQTFFGKNMSIDDITDAVGQVINQNRDTLLERGATGAIDDIHPPVTGTVDGTDYVLGMNRGRVGQFFPLPPK